MDARVDGVFVGRPATLVDRNGRTVRSAIAKRRVAGDRVSVGQLNLEGDEQADLTVHGGPDKAIYAYPVEHYTEWKAAGFDLSMGGVGENLALTGVTEEQVRIGDVWQWGTALLAITQPRAPCFKLAVHVGRRGAGRQMWDQGHTGWYLRVLRLGVAPTSGLMRRVTTHTAEPTVTEAFRAMDPRDRGHAELRARVLTSAFLAGQWRAALER